MFFTRYRKGSSERDFSSSRSIITATVDRSTERKKQSSWEEEAQKHIFSSLCIRFLSDSRQIWPITLSTHLTTKYLIIGRINNTSVWKGFFSSKIHILLLWLSSEFARCCIGLMKRFWIHILKFPSL